MSELVVGSLKGLSANSFVIDVASGSKLDLSAGAVLPTGSIIAVKSVTKTNTQTGSLAGGGALAISGLTISHACQSATNKVILMATLNGTQGTGEYNFNAALTANGSLIGVGDADGSRLRVGATNMTDRDAAANTRMASVSLILEHSPASTGSITYGASILNSDSSTRTMYINRSEGDGSILFCQRGACTLILMEVAG